MKRKDFRGDPLFGALSGRDVFYFLFAIVIVVTLIFYGWVFNWVGGGEDPHENPKFANGREAARHIHSAGGVPISDTKVLYVDDRYAGTNAWRIYDTSSDTNTGGSFLAGPLNKGKIWNKVTNGGWLAGWKGNFVFVDNALSGQLIYQWKTNDDKLEIFKTVDYCGGQKYLSYISYFRLSALENGWLYSFGFFNWKGPILATGSRIGPMTFARPFPTNEVLGSCWPFQGGLYVTSVDTNENSMELFVLSLRNQAPIFSNASVKFPQNFDEFIAQPDPAGKRVVWLFGREPKIAIKLRAILPSFIRPRANPAPTCYYYWSDLHATGFHFICTLKDPTVYPFLWGVNGDSIWLPDAERGIKRYELK